MKNNNKNRFIAILLIFIVSLCAVLSAIFSGILLAKSENNSNTAYADELNYDYIYSTSNLYFLGNAHRVDLLYPSGESYIHTEFKDDLNAYGGDVHRYLPTTLSLDFKYSTLDNRTVLQINRDRLGIFSRKEYEYYDAFFFRKTSTSSSLMYADTITTYNPDTYDFFNGTHITASIAVRQYDGGDHVYGAFQVAFITSGVPDISKLVSVDIFSRYQYVAPSGSTPEYYKVCNVLQYTDVNGVRIVVLLYNPFYSSSDDVITLDDLPIFEDRRYYLEYALSSNVSSSDLLSKQYFDQGYSEGKSEGYNLGLVKGFDRGHASGYSEGEARGKIIGASEANEYSFFSLISAVVDAPIQAFAGLLNFNILGFNLLGFITGLLTLGLIIWIISLILGKK